MSERLPEAGPVGADPRPDRAGVPECHAWFPSLASAEGAARPVRQPRASLSLTTPAPFAPAAAVACEGTVAELAALRAAVACPDVYLIDACAGDQLRLAAELARACRQRGERVVLLTAESIDADKLIVRLRDAGETSLLRALGAGEPANQLPSASAERVGRVHGEVAVQQVRAKLQAAARDAAGRVTSLEAEPPPGDRLGELRAERDRHATPAAPSPRLAEVAAELDAAGQSHTQAVAEFAAQQYAAEAKKPAGWMASVKRLFAADETAADGLTALAAKVAESESRAAALRREADELRAADAVAEAARAQAHADLDSRLQLAEAEQVAATADHAARLADARADAERHAASLRHFEADAPTLARRLIDATAVAVGPVSALRGDAALHASPHAPAAFDVAILTDAELLGDAELHAAELLAGRRVLLGDATPAHPPGFRNGRTPPASPFARLLHRHHAPGLHVDRGQMTAQLLPAADAALHCEALADQPEVELRFLRAGGLLAQVAFPPNFAVAAAKAFLARELGAYFLRLAAPPDWIETADAVEARVPVTAPGDRVELGDGLVEETADGWTVALHFDKSHGWTLAAAQARLADLAPTPRAARLPRPSKAPESSPARRPAGVRG